VNAVDAWRAVLEREYAALYGYGIVGGQINAEQSDEQVSVRAALRAHALMRDRAIAALESSGTTPEPGAPAYSAPGSSTGSAQRTPRELAAAIEVDCAFAYLQLIGSDTVTGGADADEDADAHTRTKEVAARWLQEAAHRQWQWSGAIIAWPGFS